MNIIFRIILCSILFTWIGREIGWIEFSGVRYHQLSQKSNVLRNIQAGPIQYAYSFLENNSHSWYEDGWISILPDYQQRLEAFIDSTTDYEIWINDLNGESIQIPGNEYCVEVVIEDLSILVSPYHLLSNKYDLFVEGSFYVTQIEGELAFTDSRKREFKHESEIKTLGISSESFNTLKLKEIWLSHLLTTMNEYVEGMPYRR